MSALTGNLYKFDIVHSIGLNLFSLIDINKKPLPSPRLFLTVYALIFNIRFNILTLGKPIDHI